MSSLPVRGMIDYYVRQSTDVTALLKKHYSQPQEEKPMSPPKLYAYPCRGCDKLMYTSIKGNVQTCFECSKISKELHDRAWQEAHPLDMLESLRKRIMHELKTE